MSERSVMWFDEMNIQKSEKDKRALASDDLENRIISEFDWIKDDKIQYTKFEANLIKQFMTWSLLIGLFKKTELDEIQSYLSVYGLNDEDIKLDKLGSNKTFNIGNDIPKVLSASEKFKEIEYDVGKIADNTRKNIDAAYSTSDNRAFNIAKDQANKKYNYMAHAKASKSKKYHIWKSVSDDRVRDDHSKCNGQTKPIYEPFDINGYKMMYPMDSSLGAPIDEIAGCRCSEEFI